MSEMLLPFLLWLDMKIFKCRWAWFCGWVWDWQIAHDIKSGRLDRFLDHLDSNSGDALP